MKRIVATLALFLTLAIWIQSMRQEAGPAQDLPGIEYLGQGPATYDVGEFRSFIVKREPYRFDAEPGPTYTAVGKERVWSTSELNAAPTAYWDEWIELGNKPAGCVVEYIGIDDDPDDRVNKFYLDDEVIHTVAQGMVFSGSFVLPRDGNLRFFAEDSVGGWITPCVDIITPTDEPTATPSPTPTDTPTMEPTETPTEGPSPTPTDGPSPTPTEPVTETPTPTETTVPPTVTEQAPTPTPDVTPEPTKKPRLLACVRINFEVGGESARRGLYNVTELGGAVYASWYAEDGWTDSGWFKDIDIVFEEIYVRVLYYPGPDTVPTEMKILNPAPGTPYGWMARGVCHAIEVAWPDEPPPSDDVSEAAETDSSVQVMPTFVPLQEEEEPESIYATLGGD